MRNIAALLRLLFSCLCCVVGVLSAYDDVPTKKADHPKMNPKPKLPEVTHYVYLDIEYIWGDNPHFSSLSMKKDWNVYQELHREKAKSLNIKYDDEKTRFTDRIVLGLFGTVAPKTVENFLGLIRCDKGKGKIVDCGELDESEVNLEVRVVCVCVCVIYWCLRIGCFVQWLYFAHLKCE